MPWTGHVSSTAFQAGGAPATNYPAAVIAADAALGGTTMRGVWDLYSTSGCRIPQASLTPSSSIVSWPAGTTRNASTGAISITASANFNGIDFGGDGIFIGGDSTVVTITDCLLNPTDGFRLWIGQLPGQISAGSPTVTLDHVTCNLANSNNVGHANIVGFNGAALTIKGSRIYNAARAMIDWGTPTSGDLIIQDTLLGAFAVNTSGSDHTEICQLLARNGTLLRCLLDPSYGLPQVPGQETAPWFWEATSAAIVGAFTNSIVLCPSVGGIYTFQCKANNNNVSVTATGSIFQKGASGYHDLTAVNPNVVTVTNGGNLFDFDTAAPIVSGF